MKKLSLMLICLFGGLTLKAQQWGDYTLYSVMNTTTAYLIDTNSNIFHTWNLSGSTGYSSYLMPGGILWRTVSHPGNTFNGGGMTGEIQKVDYNGTLLWDYVYSSTTYCAHHDICPMANGDVLIISYESKTNAEVTQAGSSVNHVMWPDKVIEVQPSGTNAGTIVWEWHAWDHLCQSYDNTKSNYVSNTADHPELLNINYNNNASISDWMHTNGVDYNAALDQIAISAHNMNELYIIDHSTTTAEAATHSGGNSGHGGDLLYRWGNPAAYGASGSADFNVVHDAHWIPAGCPHAGYLVGFNNNGISANQSCVDLFNPPLNGYNYDHTAGQAYGPATYFWRHACSGHTNDLGNSQQLPNGNMLVCIAMAGKMYEIDSNQNILWTKTVSGTVPQAFRYTACYVSGTQPAVPVISNNGGTLHSSAGTSYQWYLNGVAIPGATAQDYTPVQSGNYQVIVKDASGCASDLSAITAVTVNGVSSANRPNGVWLYPNPGNGMIHLAASAGHSPFDLQVSDLNGKLLWRQTIQNEADLSFLPSGLYLVQLTDAAQAVMHTKLILVK